MDLANRYLSVAGTAGKFHREALALLNEAKQPILPEMVEIPAGRFRMGCVSGNYCSDNELPVHKMRIASFALSKYEVTFEEYDRFAAATGRKGINSEGWGRGRRPVINVSWGDAVAYTEWLSAQTGKHYRLPSEAEWGVRGAGGVKEKFIGWGNDIGRNRANCDGCGSQWGNEKTAAGGLVQPQRLGPSRHARKCTGVGTGLLERELSGSTDGRFGLGEG